ncbi:hypothetical protein U9M48_005296 [Paspalum notatum var. saurae]|uniref:Uncharacterized protein n=1 Tax=Paspalum notatum var. saurae TaxID=547442 RepID=A0AAQ3SLC7_PASNO
MWNNIMKRETNKVTINIWHIHMIPMMRSDQSMMGDKKQVVRSQSSDPACKELSMQEKPVIKEPGDRLYPEPEDEGSLIKSVPDSRGCLGQSLTTRQTNLV